MPITNKAAMNKTLYAFFMLRKHPGLKGLYKGCFLTSIIKLIYGNTSPMSDTFSVYKSFYSPKSIFGRVKVFNFNKVQLINYFLLGIIRLVSCLGNICLTQGHKYFVL